VKNYDNNKMDIFKKKVSYMLTNKVIIIPCSIFSTQNFCEYQFYLEYIKGIEGESLNEIQVGIERHEKLYEEFMQKANIKMDLKKFLSNKKGIVIARELGFSKSIPFLFYPIDNETLLCGSPDEVWSLAKEIKIIDYKPPKNFYIKGEMLIGIRRQLVAYAFLIKKLLEEYKIEKRIYMEIRNEENENEILWHNRLTKEYINDMLNVVERIKNIISGKITPVPTPNLNKCYKCKMKTKCDVFEKIKLRIKEIQRKSENSLLAKILEPS
jgi:hypothetical protein